MPESFWKAEEHRDIPSLLVPFQCYAVVTERDALGSSGRSRNLHLQRESEPGEGNVRRNGEISNVSGRVHCQRFAHFV